MIPRILIAVIATVFLLSSCKNAAITTSKLERERDSLQQIINNRSDLKVTAELSNLLDSIEGSGGTASSSGISVAETLASRIRNLGKRMSNAEAKLTTLGLGLRASQNEADAYLMLADAFRGEVEIRDSEVKILTDELTVIKDESKEMATNLASAEFLMGDLIRQQVEKDHQLADLNTIVLSYKSEEAERCYKEGQRLKANAKRVWYSSSKRKETIREAVELYKKAYMLGKPDVLSEIEQLERKITSKDMNVAPSASSE